MAEPEARNVSDIRLLRVPDLAAGACCWLSQVEEIFFTSSTVQTFASAAERSAFRDRWLGRYLDHWPGSFLVALEPGGSVTGYLAGCLIDPATHPLFADLGYVADFADLSAGYPAHLHINVHPDWRSAGIGAHLIEAFAAHAAQAGSPGMHIVTGRAARNVRFYERCGFRVLRSTRSPWGAAEIAFLGRSLAV